MKKKVFRVRFEELPALGEFVEASFLHDRELFAAYSPVYANGFAEDYHEKLLTIKSATLPHMLTSQAKNATAIQHEAHESLLKLLNHLERYWQLGSMSLQVNINDLKLSNLRKSLRKHDAEGAILGAKALQQLIQPCLTVLQEKGLPTEKAEELNRLIDLMEKQNLEQNDLLNQRRRLVEENLTLWNEFWNLVADVMKTGKLIHENNPVRRAEYTEKNLRSRVRLVIAKSKQEEELSVEAAQEPVEEPEPVASS
jgi:hypothetical protein